MFICFYGGLSTVRYFVEIPPALELSLKKRWAVGLSAAGGSRWCLKGEILPMR